MYRRRRRRMRQWCKRENDLWCSWCRHDGASWVRKHRRLPRICKRCRLLRCSDLGKCGHCRCSGLVFLRIPDESFNQSIIQNRRGRRGLPYHSFSLLVSGNTAGFFIRWKEACFVDKLFSPLKSFTRAFVT